MKQPVTTTSTSPFRLADDPAFKESDFVVLDFEGTTPAELSKRRTVAFAPPFADARMSPIGWLWWSVEVDDAGQTQYAKGWTWTYRALGKQLVFRSRGGARGQNELSTAHSPRSNGAAATNRPGERVVHILSPATEQDLGKGSERVPVDRPVGH